MQIVYVLGKILLGGFFVWNGIEHFTNIKNLTGYAKHKKLPMAREMVYLSGIMLLLGGFSIIFSRFVDIGILVLIIFMLGTTFMMHRFWELSDPMEKMHDKISFMKNLAITGALLMLLIMYVA